MWKRVGRTWWKSERAKADNAGLYEERLLLVQEIRKAHLEWEVAQRRFDYVLGKEQIDYAIYALEAAEKRFEMLLKQAKDIKISEAEVCASRVAGGAQ